jgi:hypothetical protein
MLALSLFIWGLLLGFLLLLLSGARLAEPQSPMILFRRFGPDPRCHLVLYHREGRWERCLNRQQPLQTFPASVLQIARDGAYITVTDSYSPDTSQLIRLAWSGQSADIGIERSVYTPVIVRPDGGALIYFPRFGRAQNYVLRDLATGEEVSLALPDLNNSYYEMQWSGDGRWLFAVEFKAEAQIIKILVREQGQDTWAQDELLRTRFYSYSPLPSGPSLIFSLLDYGQADYRLYRWPGPGQTLSPFSDPLAGGFNYPFPSPDGGLLASIGEAEVLLFSLADGAPVASFRPFEVPRSLSWSSDSQCMVYTDRASNQEPWHLYRACRPNWQPEALNPVSPDDEREAHYTPPLSLAWRPSWLVLGAGLMISLSLFAFRRAAHP